MKKATLLFLFAACLIGGMMTTAAGRKSAPAIRVAPEMALADEVVSVSMSDSASPSPTWPGRESRRRC